MSERYLAQVLSPLMGHVEWLSDAIDDGRCESPIEKGLLIGLVGRWFINRRIRFDRGPCGLAADRTTIETDYTQTVYLQHAVASSRVDFAMHLELREDGRFLSQWFAIECDGHDFHEKTKQQAQRDRERERHLTAAGFKILRFTGSEIYRDTWHCAEEIDNVAWRTVCAFRDSAS